MVCPQKVSLRHSGNFSIGFFVAAFPMPSGMSLKCFFAHSSGLSSGVPGCFRQVFQAVLEQQNPYGMSFIAYSHAPIVWNDARSAQTLHSSKVLALKHSASGGFMSACPSMCRTLALMGGPRSQDFSYHHARKSSNVSRVYECFAPSTEGVSMTHGSIHVMEIM